MGEKFFARDLERMWILRFYVGKPFYRKLRCLLTDYGIHFVAIYRFRQFARRVCRRHKIAGALLYLPAGLLAWLAGLVYNIQIENKEDIGPGLYMAHPFGIFIGETIGKNCILHQCTTIGLGYSDGKVGAPAIGDNVWIGPNVVITGKIGIGSNSTISAGSVVTRDIPENALAAGNPARVILAEYDNRLLYVERESADSVRKEGGTEQ